MIRGSLLLWIKDFLSIKARPDFVVKAYEIVDYSKDEGTIVKLLFLCTVYMVKIR